MATGAILVAFIFPVLVHTHECSLPPPDKSAALIQKERAWRNVGMRLSCEKRGLENCYQNPICTWNIEVERCQARIAWFHPMKCGSTFGATLAHFANSSLPELAHMPTCTGMVADFAEDRCNPIERVQGPLEFFKNKYPLDLWFRDVFWTGGEMDKDPGNHRPVWDDVYEQWKGHFVGLFRPPKSRVSSSFNHFRAGNEKFADLERFFNVSKGTVTMMLAGGTDAGAYIDCEFKCPTTEKDPDCLSETCRRCMSVPTEADVQKALSRLDGFAFVGLTDHFDLSVCLFHAMFGGDCYPVEFVNMRNRSYPEELAKDLEKIKIEDPFDEKIYNAASERFWSTVQRFGLNQETCDRICPKSGATFD